MTIVVMNIGICSS